MKILIVGAGLYGCTAANLLKKAGHDVTIAESSPYIGGMCYTHDFAGIEVHDFGPHIFHTDDDWVWSFVNSFTPFNRYEHHVVAKHGKNKYFLPFNLMLLQQFFKKDFDSPIAAKNFLKNRIKEDIADCGIDANNPKNLEEQAISLIGVELYEAFIENYTRKQWHKDPKELSADIIKRIPVRNDYNISYFNDKYVGLPECGYTTMLERMTADIPIYFTRKMDIDAIQNALYWFDSVIYTGPLDELFDYTFGKLEWRSLKFKNDILPIQNYQGTACVNYVDADVEYTRIHEYKYYHRENKLAFDQNMTVIQTETPQDWDISKPRYYPVNNSDTAKTYAKYKQSATSVGGMYVGGRLGKYKYYDMDDTILAAVNDLTNWKFISENETKNI